MPSASDVPPASPTSSPPSGIAFTRVGMRRGFIDAQPLAVGSFIYAVAFGVLAMGSGLSVWQAVLMSFTVYSGSAQTAAVGAWATGAGIVAILVTAVLLNARYVLFGAALRPWLSGVGPGKAYGSLYILGDSSWVLSMRAYDAGERDAGYVFGSAAAMFFPWVGGTLVGAVTGAWVPDPKLLALDFFLVAFCAAMMSGMLRVAVDLWPALAAVVAAVAADRWLSPGWPIVAAGVAGIVTAWWRASPSSEPSGESA